jgi:transposase
MGWTGWRAFAGSGSTTSPTKKGHKYLMVVVDHDTGRVVWARQGRDQATVRAFFDALGPARAGLLTHVSCAGATWIHDVIAERAPQALICMDPFHVQQWAGQAVDEVRRRITREAKAASQPVTDSEDRGALLISEWKKSLSWTSSSVSGPLRRTRSSRSTCAAPGEYGAARGSPSSWRWSMGSTGQE